MQGWILQVSEPYTSVREVVGQESEVQDVCSLGKAVND